MTFGEIILLGLVVSLVVGGGVLLWCRKAPAACATAGAAAGMLAILRIFQFRVSVSRTRDVPEAGPAGRRRRSSTFSVVRMAISAVAFRLFGVYYLTGSRRC